MPSILVSASGAPDVELLGWPCWKAACDGDSYGPGPLTGSPVDLLLVVIVSILGGLSSLLLLLPELSDPVSAGGAPTGVDTVGGGACA